MRVSDIYSGCLAAADLDGAERTVTITGGELRTFDDGTKRLFLQFAEHAKPLALNVTNARKIALLHGDEVTAWKGKRITLYPTTTQYLGKEVACIRIRDQVPQLPQQEPTQLPAADGAVRF